MRERLCTIDSSCVVALQQLGLLPQLSFLFSKVLLPKAVREELSKRRATKDHLKTLFREYAFFQRCDDFDRGAVDLLLAERSRDGSQDRGEAEAVAQAAQIGATVIVDDQWGRKLAVDFNLDVHGTFYILRRFQQLELISPSDLRRHFLTLREVGIRLPWAKVDEALTELGEERLSNP